MEAGVPVLVGPKGEGDNGEIIDKRDGVPIFCEIDGADVELAGVAGLDAHVRELLGDIDGELVFRFFTTGGAEKAAKIPFAHAKGTKEEALASVTLEAQGAEHGEGTTTRANAGCGVKLRYCQVGGE